jgi:Type IV secretion-system coupling protein DNA-binding domain
VLEKINDKEKVCYFGMAKNSQQQYQPFGILDGDRPRHLYILGKTGVGKSTMLQNMCLQDIWQGKGVCFIDPHGDTVEYILDRLPENRLKDVIYFNPADVDYPIGLNILQPEKDEQPFLICSGLMSVFKRIWQGMWSSRMEYILNNTLHALLEEKDATLLGVIKMLSNQNYAKEVASRATNPLVRNFWLREYMSFHEKYRQEAVSPILNKIGQFFSTEVTRNILGQTTSSFSFRDVMENRKILLVNLSKGRLGEDNSDLLGSLIITKLQLTAMSRVDTSKEGRSNFCLYVDEFQNFTTDSFASILSEARKYGLNITLAHQYIDQLKETGNDRVMNAIFGNVGSMVIFQVGAKDAERLLPEFEPNFNKQDLINLDRWNIATKISVMGKTGQAFMARSMPPVFENMGGKKDYFVELSRKRYARNRREVAEKIKEYLLTDKQKKNKLKQGSKNNNIPLPIAHKIVNDLDLIEPKIKTDFREQIIAGDIVSS